MTVTLASLLEGVGLPVSCIHVGNTGYGGGRRLQSVDEISRGCM